MDQVNAVIDCDVARLNISLRPWFARQGHNFVVDFRRVPADVVKLFVRVFRANGAYFDITANEHQDGRWTARVPAACFGEVGDFSYEVHATAADDQPCAIGEGRISVGPFSTTTTPVEPGEIQEVQQLPCEGGGFVQVMMKWDGFSWVPCAVYNAGVVEDGQ